MRGGGIVRIPAVGIMTLVLIAGAVSIAAAQDDAPFVQLCGACHPSAQPAPSPTFPSLSGQHAEYLLKQLRDYKAGRRTSAIMMGPLAAVPRSAMPALAVHFSHQTPPSAREPGDAARAERGKAIFIEGVPDAHVANCAGCHEANGAGHATFPRIAGQSSAYIEQQLLDFRAGHRTNDRARVMRVVAAGLTDEDIKAVSEYVATLAGAE
jgi:cytochrome c553